MDLDWQNASVKDRATVHDAIKHVALSVLDYDYLVRICAAMIAAERESCAKIEVEDLLRIAVRWSNISIKDLVNAGVITGTIGGSDWSRFNKDPMIFIMKLPRDRLPALCTLLNQ